MREPALTEYDPPRPRLTGDERRKGILRAARSEFARVGFYGASTASIARVAGCSEPMLYKHFAGKLDLFMQALEDSIERARGMFESIATGGANIVEQTQRFLEQLMADPGYLELTQLRRIAVTVDEPRVQAMLAALEDQIRDRIAIAIQIGVDQGVVRSEIDADYVAFCWLGFMQAACFREALEPGSFRDSAGHISTWLRSLDLKLPYDAKVAGIDVA
jgi:AcrR family transcriptional regulator